MIKWCLAIGLHAVWLFAFLYLWNHGGIGNINYDSLSVSMSILQTALVIFGFIGFGYISIMADRAARATADKVAKETADTAAKEAAKDVATKIAREVARNVVKSELPAIARREFADQIETEDVLGDEGAKETQAAVDSLDGDTK